MVGRCLTFFLLYIVKIFIPEHAVFLKLKKKKKKSAKEESKDDMVTLIPSPDWWGPVRVLKSR